MSETPREPSGAPGDPTEPVPSVPGRSRYEDYDLSPPTPALSTKRRTPTIAVAALVLAFSGILPLITAVAFKPSAGVAIALVVLGVAELAGAALVFTLQPIGRPVGIVLGSIGLVLGVVSAASSPANGLVTLALNGYVIYALASSGPAFRRS
jgi:uncharacterized membrane protein HdeD (DUF308 family)